MAGSVGIILPGHQSQSEMLNIDLSDSRTKLTLTNLRRDDCGSEDSPPNCRPCAYLTCSKQEMSLAETAS
jgi:hypothetical protein